MPPPSRKAAASSSNAMCAARSTACWSSAASWSPPPAARPPRWSVTAESTIDELIDSQINSDPRRGAAEEFPLDIIALADNPVARLEVTRQGFAPDSIPPAGREVLIVRSGNHTDDVTDLVHPETAATASLAARIVGLDIAGVDLVCEDISRPLDEQRGAIVEVNAGPGLLMHLKPESGQPRPVGRAIVDELFPNGDDGRIPVVGVSGSFGKTTVARLIARLLRSPASIRAGLQRRPVRRPALHRQGRQRQLGIGQPHPDEPLRRSRRLRKRQRHHSRRRAGLRPLPGRRGHQRRCRRGTLAATTWHARTGVHRPAYAGRSGAARRVPPYSMPASPCWSRWRPVRRRSDLLCCRPRVADPRRTPGAGQAGGIRTQRQVVLASGDDETAIVSLKGIPLTDGGRSLPGRECPRGHGAAWALGIGPE
jgi:hypothetical protein